MGWGRIAQNLGCNPPGKLCPIISSMKNANQSLASTSTSSTGGGIVSGSGKSLGNSGHGASAKGNSGQGIVSASGRSIGNAYGKGIVTGSGQVSGADGAITSNGRHGNSGQAKGHNK